jgi:hypothetical protein
VRRLLYWPEAQDSHPHHRIFPQSLGKIPQLIRIQTAHRKFTKLAVLRLPPPEREIEIVEEARTAQSYDWWLLSHDCLSFGLCK